MLKLKEGWNKIKNLIKIEEEPTDPLSLSLKNFSLHYTDPKKAILKDIDNIKSCKLPYYERDFIWLFFLGIIPFKHPLNWQKILTTERAKYLETKKKYFTKDIEDFVNLNREKDTYKYDDYKTILPKEEFDLLNLIKIDVERTYQENEIFTKDEIKQKLTSVLYVYAKENPQYGYKQGMNDILGVFLYVLYKNYFYEDEFCGDNISCVYSIFHSNNFFIEHDLYLVFTKFMNKGISEFFLYNTAKYQNGMLGKTTLKEKKELKIKEILNCNDSELKKRVYILYYKRFKAIDIDFYELLVDKVEPELFLTRWYLCCFTREFKLEQIVCLWDIIIMYEFVEKKLYQNKKLLWHYNVMDYVALSMLINCKPDVSKKEDINELMSSIMHYPDNISVEKIAKKALEIYLHFNPDIDV